MTNPLIPIIATVATMTIAPVAQWPLSRNPPLPPSIVHAQALRSHLTSLGHWCDNRELWNTLLQDLSTHPDSQVIIVLCAVDSASRPGHLLYLYDLETIPLRVWGTTGGNNTGDKGSSSPPIPKTESPIHHRLIITRDELRALRGDNK